MDIQKIRELISLLSESDVAELEVEENDVKVTIRKHAPIVTMQAPSFGAPMMPYPTSPFPVMPAPVASPSHAPSPQPVQTTQPASEKLEATPQPSATQKTIKAPIVGTFYRAPTPDDPAYVNVGDSISEGKTLCIIEAMKLMNEIEAEINGKIVEILVENGSPVEFDQPLFIVEV